MPFSQKCRICKKKFQSKQRFRTICDNPSCLSKFNSIKTTLRNKSQAGKTYEEQFGSRKANELKALRSKNIIGYRNPSFGGLKPEQKLKMSLQKRGKTYEEIYGMAGAERLRKIRRAQLLKHNIRRNNKKGNMSMDNAPMVILMIGVIFLLLATIAFINQKFGDDLKGEPIDGCNATNTTSCSPAYQTTQNLNTEISGNTSIVGIILTIFLVGLILTILIGITLVSKSRGRS